MLLCALTPLKQCFHFAKTHPHDIRTLWPIGMYTYLGLTFTMDIYISYYSLALIVGVALWAALETTRGHETLSHTCKQNMLLISWILGLTVGVSGVWTPPSPMPLKHTYPSEPSPQAEFGSFAWNSLVYTQPWLTDQCFMAYVKPVLPHALPMTVVLSAHAFQDKASYVNVTALGRTLNSMATFKQSIVLGPHQWNLLCSCSNASVQNGYLALVAKKGQWLTYAHEFNGVDHRFISFGIAGVRWVPRAEFEHSLKPQCQIQLYF
jgi:hypothetical protein